MVVNSIANENNSEGTEEDTADELVAAALTTLQSPRLLLDLSAYRLQQMPCQLLQFSSIEYVYLSDNQLTRLPDDFFLSLSNLKWLDVRFNGLTQLPTAGLSGCRRLHTLLLSHNNLTHLPLELAGLRCLNSLSVSHNPGLQFPPQPVIDRGLSAIKKCLRQAHAVISRADPSGESSAPASASAIIEYNESHFHELLLSDSEDEEETAAMSTAFGASSGHVHSSKSVKQRVRRPSDEFGDLSELRPRSASLQKRKDYQELRRERDQRIREAGASGKRRTPKSLVELQDDVRLREMKMKISAEEQRLKDKMQLESWRQELKEVQRKHFYGAREPASKMAERTREAPFAVREENLRLKSRRDMKQPPEADNRTAALGNMLTPRSKHRIEQARAAKDGDLERRIKMHSLNMRRKKPRSATGGKSATQAAAEDLKVALDLQKELQLSKMNLD